MEKNISNFGNTNNKHNKNYDLKSKLIIFCEVSM